MPIHPFSAYIGPAARRIDQHHVSDQNIEYPIFDFPLG